MPDLAELRRVTGAVLCADCGNNLNHGPCGCEPCAVLAAEGFHRHLQMHLFDEDRAGIELRFWQEEGTEILFSELDLLLYSRLPKLDQEAHLARHRALERLQAAHAAQRQRVRQRGFEQKV